MILLDILLPDLDGLKVLERIKQEDPDATVIMITATRTVKTAVEAMKLGAYDYVTKPFDVDELRLIANRALSNQALQREVRYLRERIEECFDFGKMIGKGEGMREIFSLIRRIAPTKSTVRDGEKRNRERIGLPRHPLSESPKRRPLCNDQLRRHPGNTHRK